MSVHCSTLGAMRIPGRTILTACTIALAVGFLSACTPSQPVAHPTKTSSPTPSPIFTSDADALAAATAAYRNYEQLTDAIGHDGGAHPERIKPYVNAAGYEYEQQSAAKMQSEHSHQVGSTVLNNVRLQSHEEANGVATISIYTCEDISAVDRVVADGKSLLSADRPDFFAYVAVFRSNSDGHLVLQSNKNWTGGGICKF
jgi:hypothetical protein